MSVSGTFIFEHRTDVDRFSPRHDQGRRRRNRRDCRMMSEFGGSKAARSASRRNVSKTSLRNYRSKMSNSIQTGPPGRTTIPASDVLRLPPSLKFRPLSVSRGNRSRLILSNFARTSQRKGEFYVQKSSGTSQKGFRAPHPRRETSYRGCEASRSRKP